jgi:mRNA interferase HigB
VKLREVFMKLRGTELLHDFPLRHPDTRRWVSNWIADVKAATWNGPQDVKNRHATASFLADNIIFFNVKGNDYRMQVKVFYKSGEVLVKWIGTHDEYTKKFIKVK